MKKKNVVKVGGILFLFMVLFIFVIPVIVNELYKNNIGYLTLWEASDVLAYYGIILQGVFSMVALYITVLYIRKQIKYEHMEHVASENIKSIEYDFSDFMDILYPLKLVKIKLVYENKEKYLDGILEELLLYQVDLKITINKMKCFMSLEKYSHMKELLDELLVFASLLIKCADDLYICYNKIGVSKNEKVITTAYNDIEVICEKLQALTNFDYQKILIRKRKSFSQLEENLECTLSEIINI